MMPSKVNAGQYGCIDIEQEGREHELSDCLKADMKVPYRSPLQPNACMGIAEVKEEGELQIVWGNTALQRLWPRRQALGVAGRLPR